MTERISRIVATARRFPGVCVGILKRNPKKSIVALVVVVLAVVFLSKNEEIVPVTEEVTVPMVSVATIGELSGSQDSLTVVGEVRSVTQVELRTQSSGEVTNVNVSAGQYVGAGTILAEIENAAERAMVLSAQGALAGAEASLARVYAGARTEDRTSASAQAEGATIARAAAEESARATYSQSYSLAQDAIFAKADDFFTNTYTVRPSFRVRTASYDERRVLENERVAVGEILDAWKVKTYTTLDVGTLDTALTEAQRDLTRIKSFLDSISAFVSEQTLDDDFTAADKSAQEGALIGARASIDGARAAVAGARQGLAAALTAEVAASGSESKLATGDRPEDVRIVEAGVLSARGAYAGALAGLERTLIRTPIAGTVTTFNVGRGDFVSMQEVVAVVANEKALEIEAFVSESARERITIDAPVRIDGTYDGVVTSVAPGLDPVTKKSRITVGVTGDAPLVNGSFAEIAFTGSTTLSVEKPTSETLIPITAIKVLPSGLAVFTVRDDGTLEARTVKEGTILGDRMLIQEGLPKDLAIVIDVRGLIEGENVTIAQ
jgi:multidrug efflux pump subunit AcrA (membrane-fusion protein)